MPAAARKAGQVPILTGGTGMYIRSAEGIAPFRYLPDLRAEVVARHQRLGGVALVVLQNMILILQPGLTMVRHGRPRHGSCAATGEPLSNRKRPPQGAIEGARLILPIDPPRLSAGGYAAHDARCRCP